MATKWQTRPSSLYDIKDPFVAYSFDRAVTLFGSSVESDMEDAAADAKSAGEAYSKRQRVLDKWLGIDSLKAPGRFRDPAAGHSKVSGTGQKIESV